MTGKAARHHHFVPQFYLRNFLNDARLWVFDTQEIKLFPTGTRNIAGERDLYRLEGPDPELAEEMFGKIEGTLTPIIAEVIRSEELPKADSDDFVSIVTFIATLVTRHPDLLKRFEVFSAEVLAKTLHLEAEMRARAGQTQTRVPGVSVADLQQASESLRAGRIKIHIPRDHSIGATLQSVESISEALMLRSWCLAKAIGNEFITSTHPVMLCWNDLSLHDHHNPGFGHIETTVYFPISPNLMMVGKSEAVKPKAELDAQAVAGFNGLHGIRSPRFLISQTDSSTVSCGKFGHCKFSELPTVFNEIKGTKQE